MTRNHQMVIGMVIGASAFGINSAFADDEVWDNGKLVPLASVFGSDINGMEGAVWDNGRLVPLASLFPDNGNKPNSDQIASNITDKKPASRDSNDSTLIGTSLQEKVPDQ